MTLNSDSKQPPDRRPAPTFFELAQYVETHNHAAHLAAEDAEARRRLRRRPARQPWAPRYTRDKAASEIVTRPGKENRHRDEVTVDRDGEVVGHGRDSLRPEYIARGYHIARERHRVWVAAKSRIMPGDKDDLALNLIMEVFDLYSPRDDEAEEQIRQPVPAAHFRTAAAAADPPIPWLTVQRRASKYLGVKSTPIPGMSAGKMWTLPADHGPNRAPESDVWPDGKGGWTTSPPPDDGARIAASTGTYHREALSRGSFTRPRVTEETMTDEDDALALGAVLTYEDYQFWADYCDVTLEHIAELAGLPVRKVALMMARPTFTPEDRGRVIDAYGASAANGREWTNQEIADRAGVSITDYFWMQDSAMLTAAEYRAIWAVFDDLIGRIAVPKMIAYGAEHNVPGFEAPAAP